MTKSTRTGRHGRRVGVKTRRQLPPGWRIVDGVSAAVEVDPIIEQTRELTHLLFCAGLVGGFAYRSSPTNARAAWLELALRRGDSALCGIIERLDDDTFNATWAGLVRRLEREGAPALLEWFQRREHQR